MDNDEVYLIKDVTVDKVKTENFSYCSLIHYEGNKEIETEHVPIFYFNNKFFDETVRLAISKKADKYLGMVFQSCIDLDSQLQTIMNKNVWFVEKINRMSFWERLKFLFTKKI